MDLFQFLPQGRDFLRHMSHVTLLSCHSAGSLLPFNTEAHGLETCPVWLLFHAEWTLLFLWWEVLAPSPLLSRESAAQCQDLKWNLCYSPWGKMDLIQPQTSLPAIPSLSRVLAALKFFRGEIFLLCFVLLCFALIWGMGVVREANAWHVLCQWKWGQLSRGKLECKLWLTRSCGMTSGHQQVSSTSCHPKTRY